jgi:hypothetical protein
MTVGAAELGVHPSISAWYRYDEYGYMMMYIGVTYIRKARRTGTNWPANLH